MNEKELLELFTNTKEDYVMEAVESRKTSRRTRFLPVAAAIALVCMLMGCGVAYAQSMGWFVGFFSQRNEEPLSQGQIEQIEKQELAVHQAVVQEDWSIELGSVMSDGAVGYVIFRVTAPEDVSLEDVWSGNVLTSSIVPGNVVKEPFDAVVSSRAVGYHYSYSVSWEEDGDGKTNTRFLIIEIEPDVIAVEDPFGPNVDWHIFLDGLVRETYDAEYAQELMNGKYKGQTDVMFTDEESKLVYGHESCTELTWNFDVNFAQNSETSDWVDLLEENVEITARVVCQTGESIEDLEIKEKRVTLTDFRLSPFSAVATFESTEAVSFTLDSQSVAVVMKDGSIVRFTNEHWKPGSVMMKATAPIVIEEVDYILIPDGTKLHMP